MEQFRENYPVAFDQIAAVLQREIDNDAAITIQRFYRKYRNAGVGTSAIVERAVQQHEPHHLVNNFLNMVI
jgi:hypothetical protein